MFEQVQRSQPVIAAALHKLPYSETESSNGGDPMTNHLLDAALTYAKRGWHVLPLHTPYNSGCSCGKTDCTSIGKHPRTVSGLKDASGDDSQIRRWWTKWPDANIGIATGTSSGIIVIDLDNAGAKRGEENFSVMTRQNGMVPLTLAAITGAGKHLFFRHPGMALRNSAGKLASHVDVRADGGYVVAAPSKHANGRMYQWDCYDQPLADAPDWILRQLQQPVTNATAPPQFNKPDEEPIPEGTRNHTLYRIGCSLRGQLAMEHSEIAKRLMLYNAARCIPPLDESEVLTIADSVCKHPPEVGKKSLNRQERNPLYWLKLNARDFNADFNILSMTDYQVGWYIKLRILAWQNAGVLPADTSKLWRLAGARSKKVFERESALVLAEYQPIQLIGEQLLLNRRMAAEYADTLDVWIGKRIAGEANRERLSSLRSLETATHASSPAPIQ